MTRVTRPHHRRTGGSTRHDPATLVAAIVAIVAVLGSVVAWQPSADAGLAAPAPDCTIPETEREVARPEDLAARYEYASLHESGHDGRGLVAAQLQFGQSVGLEEFRFFQQCLDLRQMPVTQWRFADGAATEIATGDTASLPAPGREAQSDLEIIAGAAPGLDHVHVLVAEPGAPLDQDELLAWANDRLARAARLSGLELRASLPRSADMEKVLKRELRAPFWAGRTVDVA